MALQYDSASPPVCLPNPMRSIVPVKMRAVLVDPDMQKELLHLSGGSNPHQVAHQGFGVQVFFQNKQPNAKKIPQYSIISVLFEREIQTSKIDQTWVFCQGACPCGKFANGHLHSKLFLELLCKGRSTCLHLLPLKTNNESIMTIWWTHWTHTNQ